MTELLRPRLGSLRQAAGRVNRLRKAVLASPADMGGVVARVTQFGPDASPHLVNYVVGLAARAPSEVWTDGLAGLMDMDLRHAARHVRAPALVAVGDHDRVTPPGVRDGSGRRVAERPSRGHRGRRHVAMLEAHEVFNHLLATFAGDVLDRAGAGEERMSRHEVPSSITWVAGTASGT